MELLKTRNSQKRLKLGDFIHFLLNLALPVVIFLLASRWQLYGLALTLVLLSKWRIFAVQPRFWWANIQANIIDVIVGMSVVGLMYQADQAVGFQALWAAFYAVWLVLIKPQSGTWMVALQAAIGQVLGITALFWYADTSSDLLIVVGVWAIAYSAARHVVSAYEEDLIVLLSAVWGLFVAQLAWLLNRWLVIYDLGDVRIPQIAVLVLVLGYCAAHIYDLSKQGKMSRGHLRNVFVVGGSLLFLVLTIFSDWKGSV